MHTLLMEAAFYQIRSPSIYSLLSEAAAKKSMSTELQIRGLLTPADP